MHTDGYRGAGGEDAERIIGVYRRHADAWTAARDAESAPGPMEAEWLARFRALMPARARVLDLGCGCGEPIARDLIAAGCAVTGVDASPEMIALCTQRLPGQDWRIADMRALSLGRIFDGILAWDSFFHLRPADQRAMFAVFAAHAAPRAPLMFTSGTSLGEAVGELEGEPLYHASLDAAEYRALLTAHGFGVVAHVVEDARCGGRTVWLAQVVAE